MMVTLISMKKIYGKDNDNDNNNYFLGSRSYGFTKISIIMLRTLTDHGKLCRCLSFELIRNVELGCFVMANTRVFENS